jgi:hypothetical protein
MLAKRLQEAKEGGLDNEACWCLREMKRSWLRRLSVQRRHVEILKVRFGESALQVCEVMLRDMTDSRRIDQHIQARAPVRVICLGRSNSTELIDLCRWSSTRPSSLRTSGRRCRRPS